MKIITKTVNNRLFWYNKLEVFLMNFKQEYKFYPNNRKLTKDENLKSVLQKPELSNLKKWYDTCPDFELVKKTSDGFYETIQILLNDIVYATDDRRLEDELKDAVIIGNDGGDDLYLYVFNQKYKHGVYKIDDTLIVEDMIFMASTLDDWLLD